MSYVQTRKARTAPTYGGAPAASRTPFHPSTQVSAEPVQFFLPWTNPIRARDDRRALSRAGELQARTAELTRSVDESFDVTLSRRSWNLTSGFLCARAVHPVLLHDPTRRTLERRLVSLLAADQSRDSIPAACCALVEVSGFPFQICAHLPVTTGTYVGGGETFSLMQRSSSCAPYEVRLAEYQA